MDTIEQVINQQQDEISELRRLCYLQMTQIQALSFYCNGRIAGLCGHEIEKERELLETARKSQYDNFISDLEKNDPESACLVDIRPELPEVEQEAWYRLDRYYAKP